MKFAHGWWLPRHELHLISWMEHPQNIVNVEDGRVMYQAVKQRKAMELCKSFRVAVDVGGHCALWSYYLAKRFSETHAFEPVAEHRECFVKNIDREVWHDPPLMRNGKEVEQKLVARVTLHACALGDHEGSIAIQTKQGSSGDSHMSGPGDIPMRTLDSFELQDVDFIKIDTEGAEEFVVGGGKETIMRCRPVMCVEQKGHASNFGLQKEGAVKLLESMGMRPLCPPMSGDWIMGW